MMNRLQNFGRTASQSLAKESQLRVSPRQSRGAPKTTDTAAELVYTVVAPSRTPFGLASFA